MAVALAGGLALAPGFAQDRPTPAVKPSLQAAPDQAGIPHCLESLTLSRPQQDQIKEIVREYDADVAVVWKKFSDSYMETICTEASLLAAIEDNLTEPQRKQVRDQRRKTAQHQKALAGTDEKPNQATAKPASAVEEEIAIVGVSLTAEQELAADKLQEKCLNRLRSLNRDIQGLHTRLVSLEADKLVEIENVLTKEQLLQLRAVRQNTPIALPVSAARTTPVTPK
ncbi:MAG: hypothetical protein SFU86_24780 [Pirellulaceae bacterium]|nr:hypothetical protein [Pirellulaceae bacterium]